MPRQFNGERTIFLTYSAETAGYLYTKEWSWITITLCKKINTRWIRDLNVRAKSIKLLEKKSWSLHDLELGNGFLEMTQKHNQRKKIF